MIRFALLFLMGLLLMQFVWRVSATDGAKADLAPEKVNLALRRTAHYLLAVAGDSTSRIPPVRQTGHNGWLIRLDPSFNYDTLPALLQASFDLHGIHENYDVAILRCSDGELQLGYSYFDFAHNKEAPCGGRALAVDCYNLQVTFPERVKKKEGTAAPGWTFAFAGLLAVAFFVLKRRDRPTPDAATTRTATTAETDWLHFGNSRLHVANHRLMCGDDTTVQLTYREAKLLQLFANHPNQLLQRNFIIENVWADEGILVGRSVDMFVSRLRKKLQADPLLGIVAVHGLGYRLEVG